MLENQYFNALVADYKHGMTYRELSDKYNISTKSVYNVLHRANVQLRPRGKRPKKKYSHNEIVSLRKKGLSYSQIAQMVGISRWTVARVVQDSEM